jgi:hypothetical protein
MTDRDREAKKVKDGEMHHFLGAEFDADLSCFLTR